MVKKLTVYRNGKACGWVKLDDKDYEKAKEFTWHKHHNYVQRSDRGKIIGLARFILDITDKEVEVGYIDRDTMNMVRENLTIRPRHSTYLRSRSKGSLNGY